MPEGPEIKRVATRISKVVVNQAPVEVFFSQEPLQRYGQILSGRRVLEVSSRGKALLTQFEGDLTVYTHNQLYGRWYVMRANKFPKTNRTLRFAMHTPTHSALLYSASEIHVLDPSQLAHHPYIAKLGPDALDEQITWRDILSRLQEKAFHRRSLAALYLDQKFVAGVGNYLRTEILHKSGLDPFARPCDLTRRQLGLLARNTLELSRQAYATAGITNTPGRVKSLKAAGITRSRYRHLAFARKGQDCYACAASIQRIEVSGRRIYFCPHCQSETRPS